jgi:endonuclease/exonuclease/phosphatase family metal-dependent hydrolase
MRIDWRKAGIRVLIVMAGSLAGSMLLGAQAYVRDSKPKLFSYDELVQLGSNQELSPELAKKLQVITTTPFINNEAYFDGARPRPLEVAGLGPSLRVAFWNVERGLGLDYIQLFIKNKDAFLAKMEEERNKAEKSGKRLRDVDLQQVAQEIETLKAADVWILNEVDWGVKRTGYREIVRELGKTLGMNWAYGVEFLEVDSKQLGTDQFDDAEDEESRQQLRQEFSVDKERLKALHGNAVLSRYPIRSARVVPFTIGYDWFKESKLRPLEKGKRQASKLVGEDLMREVRRGQRMTLYVDLDVPQAPAQRVTIASTHLENRTRPKTRRKQLRSC